MIIPRARLRGPKAVRTGALALLSALVFALLFVFTPRATAHAPAGPTGLSAGDAARDAGADAAGVAGVAGVAATRHSGLGARSLDCARPIRLGDEYGGWQLCRPESGSLFAGQLVYTVGIGRNIRWDVEMIEKYHTEHHGWDPTPTATDFFSKKPVPPGFTFHKFGLGAADGNLTLKLPHGNFDSYTVMSYWQKAKSGTVVTVPILTVRSMMRKLDHDHLAILKIDIEGAEFDVIDAWERERFSIPADQVLIEFHERYFSHEKGYRSKVRNAVAAMGRLGFDLIVRTNLECTFARRDAISKRQSGVIKGK